MFVEFFLEVLFIKIKVKGYLENIGKNTKETIDTLGIKNKYNVIYNYNNIKHKIIFNKKNILLVRENEEFIHNFNFELSKETDSEYYIKEYSTNIDVPIITNKLNISDNSIEIEYLIKETNEQYRFVLEMSDK